MTVPEAKLRVEIDRAYNLPKSDYFCKVRLVTKQFYSGTDTNNNKNKAIRTKVVKRCGDPVWNEEVILPVKREEISESDEVRNLVCEIRVFEEGGLLRRSTLVETVNVSLDRFNFRESVNRMSCRACCHVLSFLLLDRRISSLLFLCDGERTLC